MNINTFLKNVKESKSNVLFTIPKQDKKDDMPHIRNNIFEPFILHQCDILYLPTSQFGFKYCLVCVDVYNSKIDAVALKEKNSKAIVKGLETIYLKQNILELPITIQFDNGTEFNNKEVKSMMKKLETNIKFTLTNRHRQNAVVEKANKRLGTLILKFQAENELITKKKSTAWHKHLPKLIEFLNNNVKVNTNKYDPYADVAGNKEFIELLSIGDSVHKILDYPIRANDDKRVGSTFRSGDIRWSKDKFKIIHFILNPKTPVMYMLNKLDKPDKIDSSVAYTRSQLLLSK
jgi:transposase InsO family protein